MPTHFYELSIPTESLTSKLLASLAILTKVKVFLTLTFLRGSRGGDKGSRPLPPEKSQNLGFLSNTGPDPLKNHKATKPAFNVGPPSARQRNAI